MSPWRTMTWNSPIRSYPVIAPWMGALLFVSGGPPGTDRLAQNLSFYLFAPERLEAPILLTRWPRNSGRADPWDVPFPPALEERTERLGHHAICDPISAFPTEGERLNPYACGPELGHDCYDITIINSTSVGLSTHCGAHPRPSKSPNPKPPTHTLSMSRSALRWQASRYRA